MVISLGKIADITVFDHDILKIPEDEILNTKVDYTIVNGKIVFEKNKLIDEKPSN